jgi:uncharacterized protein (TIGR03083 family)
VSPDRVTVLREERGAVLDLCRTLSTAEWAAASDCAGWSVQDVVAHMGAAYHGVFTPWLIRTMRTSSIERSNDGDVESRRGWAPARVLREYEAWGGRLLAIAPLTQRPPLRDLRLPLGDIGKYPMGLLTSAFTFDHHVHLRHDIAVALGRTLPAPSAEHMAVVTEWLLGGLPQMCGASLGWLDRPLALVLTGGGGGAWTIGPLAQKGLQVQEGRSPAAAATITGGVVDFPIWGTRRRPWRDFDLAIEGDEAQATRFLDALNLV